MADSYNPFEGIHYKGEPMTQARWNAFTEAERQEYTEAKQMLSYDGAWAGHLSGKGFTTEQMQAASRARRFQIPRSLQDYGWDHQTVKDVLESYTKMGKKDFERLAKSVHMIEAGITAAHVPLPPEQLERVMEIVVAQIAMACAERSTNFDSFKFVAAARRGALHPKRKSKRK